MQDAAPRSPASDLPQSFLLKCLEQVRKIQAEDVVLQERLVSERGREGTQRLPRGCRGTGPRGESWERAREAVWGGHHQEEIRERRDSGKWMKGG